MTSSYPITSFDTVDELWLDAASKVLTDGAVQDSRDGGTKELLGYTARLLDPRAHFLLNPVRRLSPSYAAAETLWYLSGVKDISLVVAYAPQYTRFAPDGFAHGAYGHRMGGPNLIHIHEIVEMLMRKPDSRQAVLAIWHPDDLAIAIEGSCKDIPCTLSLQFLLRDRKLHLRATMRSNDIWLGLPYDIFAFTTIQMIVADLLGVGYGWYEHSAGSLHVYERNINPATLATFSVPQFSVGCMDYPLKQGLPSFRGYLEQALALEEAVRCGRTGAPPPDAWLNSILGQLVTMASTRWWPNAKKRLTTKLLRDYIDNLAKDKD